MNRRRSRLSGMTNIETFNGVTDADKGYQESRIKNL